MVVLSRLTGWTLSDIGDMTTLELADWLAAAADVQRQANTGRGKTR